MSDPDAADTAGVSRDHVVNTSASGLVTIAGGKWTTYRKMAIDGVDEAIRVGGLSAGPSRTFDLPLVGGAGYAPTGAGELQERFGLEPDVASHLNAAYGDRAEQVALLAQDEELAARLADGHAYLEAEVVHAVRHEQARSGVDVLARRMRLAFLDQKASLAVVDRVTELIAAELGWDEARAAADRADTVAYLV